MNQTREFWQAQWSRMTLQIIQRLNMETYCMKSNTVHNVKWKRIVAGRRWIRIVAQRHKVRWTRIEAQRRGHIHTTTKCFFIWWTCARLGINPRSGVFVF